MATGKPRCDATWAASLAHTPAYARRLAKPTRCSLIALTTDAMIKRMSFCAAAGLALAACSISTPQTESSKAGAKSSQDGAVAESRADASTRAPQPRGAADAGVRQPRDGSADATTTDTDADSGTREPMRQPMSEPDAGGCVTRITYGSAWIHPPERSADTSDRVDGLVTWDGSCQIDASGNSFAELSNGFRPYFTGRNGCVIALDVQGSCATAAAGCSTRVHYGASWLHPDAHDDAFDDVPGVVTTNAQCISEESNSYLVLSNGWQPHFMGQDSCAVSLRYNQCNGLFANPLVNADCPDPSVIRDGDQYVMTCTSGNPAYPIRTSKDLVTWQLAGTIFTEATKPHWADRDFWAPELHRVADRYVVYYSARHRDGDLAIGVATASSLLGPYEDRGAPLVRDELGAIDAHQFEAEDGTHYLLWKRDGNAHGQPTPIVLQPLAVDGLELIGEPTTLLTNTEAWEANVIEGPWLIYESGYYYLFYSGNSYASAGYALGVARATSIAGPYTKAPEPIVISSGPWAGPGHGAALRAPTDDWVFVFHAWPANRINQSPPGRQVLLTRISWVDNWPTMQGAPSSLSQPMP